MNSLELLLFGILFITTLYMAACLEYGVYISQLIRYALACNGDADVFKLRLYNDYRFNINVSKIVSAQNVIKCARECIAPGTTTSASFHGTDCLCHPFVFTKKEDADYIPGATYIRPDLSITGVNPTCPANYYYNITLSLCIKFYEDYINHAEAESICNGQGSSLMKIDSIQKQELIRKYLGLTVPDIGADVHIQGHYTQTNWYFDDITVFPYNNWAVMEPNIGPDTAFLVMDVTDNGRWKTINSEYTASFICEKYL